MDSEQEVRDCPGGKVRNIDDLSEFSVNQCYGTCEKLDLGGVDEVVSLASAWIRIAGGSSDIVEVELSDGEVLTGRKCKEFAGRSLELSGRCMDLKAAYKQLALKPTDRPNAVLAVLQPSSGNVKFFQSFVLPFGATGAVMTSCRSFSCYQLSTTLMIFPM